MENIKEFTELELNIKALERMGIKVKHNSNPMINTIDSKDYFQLKDIDKGKNIVSFYFSSFGNIDSDGDILVKGAFTKTFKENFTRIKHLYNHNKTQSPGVIKELNQDNHGAYAVSQLIPSTLGKDIMMEYEYGVVTEHSMGFQTIKEKSSQLGNEILEVKLWEVSSLTAWGANELTPVIAKDEDKIKNLLASLDSLLHDSNISDERAKQLQKEFDLLKAKLNEPPKKPNPHCDYSELLKHLQI